MVVRHGEVASCDLKVVVKFLAMFAELVEAEGYTPQQVFNCSETGLF